MTQPTRETGTTARATHLLSIVLLAAALSGCSNRPSFDKVLSREDARSIQSAAIVTSRVTESPYYANCRDEGIAVFDNQYHAMTVSGAVGMAGGRNEDDAVAGRFNRVLARAEFDVEERLADAFYKVISQRAPFSVWAPADVHDLHHPVVRYPIDNEVVRRHKDYRAIASALRASVLIDLRLVEFALVYTPVSKGVQLRLRVRVKIVHYPDNTLLFSDEFVSDYETRETEQTVGDYLDADGSLLKRNTNAAIEALAQKIVSQIR